MSNQAGPSVSRHPSMYGQSSNMSTRPGQSGVGMPTSGMASGSGQTGQRHTGSFSNDAGPRPGSPLKRPGQGESSGQGGQGGRVGSGQLQYGQGNQTPVGWTSEYSTIVGKMRKEEEASKAGASVRPDNTPGFIGRVFLQQAARRLQSDPSPVFTQEALSLTAQAAEHYFKTLLRSALSAQTHRTCTSHTRAPPFISHSSTLPSKSGNPGLGKTVISYGGEVETDAAEDEKPMWSHRITSDPAAVMDALTRQNKEQEVSFRASRMDRIAREAEMARIREIHLARMREQDEAAGGVQGNVGADLGGALGIQYPGTPGGEGATSAISDTPATPAPSTPLPTNNTSNTPNPNSTSTPVPTRTPGPALFGQIKPSTGSKKKKPNAKTGVSNETALKMSNATAMRSAGIKMGKYSWLSGGAPNVSSPLAGKRKGKRKVDESGLGVGNGDEGEDEDGDGDGEGEEGRSDDEGLFGGAGMQGSKRGRTKSKLSQSTTAATVGGGGSGLSAGGRRKRPRVSAPTRRLVTVDPQSHTGKPLPFINGQSVSGAAGGSTIAERRIPDDRALCAADVVFAIKRDKSVIGADQVVRRAVVRAGIGRGGVGGG